VTNESHSTPSDERLRRLPSLVAIPLRDYLWEAHPVLRLHRLCDAVEILVRFLMIAALGEVRRLSGTGPLPARLLRAFQPNIERPTLGRWRDMLGAAVTELADEKDLVLPELPDFVRRELAPALRATITVEREGRKERRDAGPTESVLIVRNDLVHGLAMTATAAQTLLNQWAPWLDGLLHKLAFLERVDVCVVTDHAVTRLVGASVARGSEIAAHNIPPDRLQQLQRHVIVWERQQAAAPEARFLDLWPLCNYGHGEVQDLERARQPRAESPLMYFRYEQDRLLYAALGVDLPRAELSDEAVVQQFRGLFRLAARSDSDASKTFDFEEEIRRDSDALVGRRAEIAACKQAIREVTSGVGGVLWIGGAAGIGKSFLMARLAADLGNAAYTCRIAWRFKARDVATCNRYAFFRHAVERLAAFIDRPDIGPERDPRELGRQFVALLDYASRLPARPQPARVCIFLDGLDAIAAADPEFLKLPFEVTRPGLTWVCAGQPTDPITRAFEPARCRIVFPAGLPAMSDEDIRAMLVDDTGSLKYELLRRDSETIDAHTGETAVNNPAVRAVCDRAAGLPLLVHFVTQDLVSGRFTFEKLESQLPPGLEAYYDDLLRRLNVPFGELQPVLTPLVTAIAWAKAPVDEDTLQLLLRHRKVVPADNAQARALLRRALGAVRMMIRPVPGGTDNTISLWEPYHDDLKTYICRDPSSIIGAQNTLALEAYCELTGDWRAIPAGHPALAYLLRHGPEHLIAAGDWQRLVALIRDKDFLQATAAQSGTVVAMGNARRMAEALAKEGNRYWDDLLICADTYCGFSEAVRNDPSTLEALIRRGQVKEAREIINRQPDEFFRGVLMLAAAPLAGEARHAEAAAAMWEDGGKIINEKIAQGLDGGEWYTAETKTLVETLRSYVPHSLDLRPIEIDDIGRVLEREAARHDGSRRTRVPLLWRILAHAASVRARYYSSKSIWLAVSLMIYETIYAIAYGGRIPDAAFGWLGLALLLGFAWIFASAGFFRIINRALERRSDRHDRILREVAFAVERLPPAARQRHYDRLLHFFHLTRSAAMPPVCEPLVGYWTVRRFEALRDQPARMAEQLIDASRMFDSTLDSLIAYLTSLPAALVQQVFRAVLDRALTSADYGRVLYLLLPNVSRTSDVDLLVESLERYRRLTDDETKKASAPRYAKLLCCLPRTELAKALLASMQRKSPSTARWIRERLVGFVCNFPFMEDARPCVRSPFELVLAVMLIMPYPVYLNTLLSIAALIFVLPIVLLLLAAGTPLDPYGLVARFADKPAAEIRHILARTLLGADFSWNFWRHGARITAGWVLAPAALKYVRRTVIAQYILREERVEIPAAPQAMQRVVSWCLRQGLYGRPADVVLKVMDDRRLLAAAREIAPVATKARSVPAPAEDQAQLRRVLPPRSLALNLAAAVALSGAVTACWLAASRLLFANDLETWLWPYAAEAFFAGCVFLVIAQHLYPALRVHRWVPWLVSAVSRGWQLLKRRLGRTPGRAFEASGVSVPAVAVWYEVLVGAAAIAILYRFGEAARQKALDVGVAYPMERSDTPFLFGIAAIAILTAKVLVPSLIARWRGSRLLYPTQGELWRERLWCVAELALGAVLLAVLSHWQIAGGATTEKTSAAFYKYGNARYAKGDFANALQNLDHAIRFNSANADAYGLRCVIRRRSNEPDLARADCELASRLDGSVPERLGTLLYGYGQSKADNHDYEAAIAELSDAVALNPKYAIAYRTRGDAYYAKEDYDHAIADYAQAIDLDQSNAGYRVARGNAYRYKGDFDHAIGDYTRVIALDPKYAGAYLKRGDAYYGTGDLNAAAADYDMVVSLRPNDAWAYFSRGQVHLYAGSRTKALADLERAGTLDPKNAYMALWLDIAAGRSGRPSRLAQATAQIDTTKWPAPVIRFYLGQSTAADLLAAAEDRDVHTRRNQVCEANFYIGERELQKGARQEAARLFRLAAANCPKGFIEWSAADAELKALGGL
jgi:lipoprotein NlpI/predicted negative regulator of RcsB-dependent stress response